MKATELSILLNPKEAYCQHSVVVEQFLTDSRSFITAEKTAFVAIKTASGDGHKYIEAMYRLGIRCFIVETELSKLRQQFPDASFLSVDSSVRALQCIAEHHRKALDDKYIVGITGSNGKTVVKEFLNSLLAEDLDIRRSPASYNSQIGVPLSVLRLDEEMDLGLIEAGISEPHTMDALKEVIKPKVGLLTSLGSAHIEQFSSKEQLFDEKMQLFSDCEKIFACLDDRQIIESCARNGLKESLFGWSRKHKDAVIYVLNETKLSKHTEATIISSGETYQLRIPFVDDANISNILLCLSFIASEFPQFFTRVIPRVERLEGVEMRLELKNSFFGNVLINDAYSCDLEALRIALDFQRRRCRYSSMPPVLVLSDIVQTGLSGQELYKQVAELIKTFNISELFAVGEEISRQKELFQSVKASFYKDTDELINAPRLKEIKESCILIKGARRFAFERLIRSLSLMEHQTTLEVNLSAIRHNLNHYKALLPNGHKLICMIKADGYGLGALEIARLLEDSAVDYLAVAVADEGKYLRLEGIKSPIIVMNPELSSAETLFQYDLEPEVYSLGMLNGLLKEADAHGKKHYPIHIKIDSGMHRLGFEEEELPALIQLLKANESLRVASVFSHLAGADEERLDAYTQQQAETLQKAYDSIAESLGYKPLLHLLNTAGIERHGEVYAYDMARLGLGLYGISPIEGGGQSLRSVARLTTTILQVKTLEQGECTGYACRGKAESKRRIAIIPIGYADGFPRRLGNGKYSVLLRGQLCPTIGNICMDTCMVDITDVPEAVEGDRLTLFGEGELTIEAMAEVLETIPYEVLTSLKQRIQKVYLQE